MGIFTISTVTRELHHFLGMLGKFTPKITVIPKPGNSRASSPQEDVGTRSSHDISEVKGIPYTQGVGMVQPINRHFLHMLLPMVSAPFCIRK